MQITVTYRPDQSLFRVEDEQFRLGHSTSVAFILLSEDEVRKALREYLRQRKAYKFVRTFLDPSMT